MKQRITVEQLNELTDEQKERLIEWYQSVGDYTRRPLLSIGQMIELLESKTDTWDMTMRNDGEYKEYELEWHGDEFSYAEKRELCDALWQAVKVVL